MSRTWLMRDSEQIMRPERAATKRSQWPAQNHAPTRTEYLATPRP